MLSVHSRSMLYDEQPHAWRPPQQPQQQRYQQPPPRDLGWGGASEPPQQQGWGALGRDPHAAPRSPEASALPRSAP